MTQGNSQKQHVGQLIENGEGMGTKDDEQDEDGNNTENIIYMQIIIQTAMAPIYHQGYFRVHFECLFVSWRDARGKLWAQWNTQFSCCHILFAFTSFSITTIIVYTEWTSSLIYSVFLRICVNSFNTNIWL